MKVESSPIATLSSNRAPHLSMKSRLMTSPVTVERKYPRRNSSGPEYEWKSSAIPCQEYFSEPFRAYTSCIISISAPPKRRTFEKNSLNAPGARASSASRKTTHLPRVRVDLNRFELGDVIEAGYSKRHRVALRGQRDIPLEAEDHGTLSVAPDSNNPHLGSNTSRRKRFQGHLTCNDHVRKLVPSCRNVRYAQPTWLARGSLHLSVCRSAH